MRSRRAGGQGQPEDRVGSADRWLRDRRSARLGIGRSTAPDDGRKEPRAHRKHGEPSAPKIDWLPEAIRNGVADTGRRRHDRDHPGQVEKYGATISTDRRYFILSRGVTTVGDLARAVRVHWGVESMHRVLDVTFREDACRVRKEGRRTHPRCCAKSLSPCSASIPLIQEQSPSAPQPLPENRHRAELLGLRPRSQPRTKKST